MDRHTAHSIEFIGRNQNPLLNYAPAPYPIGTYLKSFRSFEGKKGNAAGAILICVRYYGKYMYVELKEKKEALRGRGNYRPWRKDEEN